MELAVKFQQHVDKCLQQDNENEETDREEVYPRGANAAFTFRVFQHKRKRPSSDSTDESTQEPFCKMMSWPFLRPDPDKISKHVWTVLEKWANDNTTPSVWMSSILTLQLNLPIRKFLLDSTSPFQVLCLGENLPAILLTLHGDEDTKESVLDFSKKTVRLLMHSLMNFCHDDFILLSCCLPYEFEVEALKDEVNKQITVVREIYRGPMKLSSSVVKSLCSAVAKVIGSSCVPCLFENKNQELFLLNNGSREIVWNLLELMTQKKQEPQRLTYNLQTETKMKIAFLEAARRLSFKDNVIIVTSDGSIQDCVKKMVDQDKGIDRLEPKLSVKYPETLSLGDSSIILGMDVPSSVGFTMTLSLSDDQDEHFPLKQARQDIKIKKGTEEIQQQTRSSVFQGAAANRPGIIMGKHAPSSDGSASTLSLSDDEDEDSPVKKIPWNMKTPAGIIMVKHAPSSIGSASTLSLSDVEDEDSPVKKIPWKMKTPAGKLRRSHSIPGTPRKKLHRRAGERGMAPSCGKNNEEGYEKSQISTSSLTHLTEDTMWMIK